MVRGVLWLLLSAALLVQVRAQSTADALLDAMSVQDKVAQMFVLSFYGAAINEPVRDLLPVDRRGRPAGARFHVIGGADVAAELDAARAIEQATRLAVEI